MIKRLHFDLETSPNVVYSWSIGYKINLYPDAIIKERKIICACYKWEHESKVHSIEWKDGDDTNLVKELHSVISEADEIVAHNLDRFDFPWINTRSIMIGLPPMPNVKQVDTLKMARRKFNFNSNKLDYISRVLLNDKKIKTGGFDLWESVMDGKNKEIRQKALDKMVKYCKKDVVLLERVYKKLKPYSEATSHEGVSNGEGRWTCPKCGSGHVRKSKTRYTKAGMRRNQMLCNSCGSYYSITDRVFNEYIHRYDKIKNGEGV